MALRIKCFLRMCAGKIVNDKQGVFWRCSKCNRINRAWRRASHWEPIKSVPHHPKPL